MLGEVLRRLGFRCARLKTGTPPRLDGRTIQWERFEPQPGDAEPTPFSFRTERIDREQVLCHIAYTTDETLRVLAGKSTPVPALQWADRRASVRGIVLRSKTRWSSFADKARHQIFLEPEGLDTNEVYVNGMSTSMPIDVQVAMVASIRGLDKAEMIRPGYAIEYDAVDATELYPQPGDETDCGVVPGRPDQRHHGVRRGGEPGAYGGNQRQLCDPGEEPVVLNRTDGYIGILIDDLVTQGDGRAVPDVHVTG